MTSLLDDFTSTGRKLLFHTEAMHGLRNGRPKAITCHIMPTDTCAKSCAFCSVHHREGNSLLFSEIIGFVDILLKYSLKSCIISGGGNPILYRCRETGKNINDVISALHDRGLQIGMISDGMPLKRFPVSGMTEGEMGVEFHEAFRESWTLLKPSSLDKLTWLRVSLAGLDHDEREAFIPDINPDKTTLGMSYVAHDLYYDEADPFHGKVSTPADWITKDRSLCKPPWLFEDRIQELIDSFTHYCKTYKPRYLRLTQNCLEPDFVEHRCNILKKMASVVNAECGREVAIVQEKKPEAPKNCWLGFVHPTLSTNGQVFACDSVVIAAAAIGYKEGKPNHKFDNKWAVCHWTEVAKLYENPPSSLVDSQKICGGCLFSAQNKILEGVVDGTLDLTPPEEIPEHALFV